MRVGQKVFCPNEIHLRQLLATLKLMTEIFLVHVVLSLRYVNVSTTSKIVNATSDFYCAQKSIYVHTNLLHSSDLNLHEIRV